MKRVWNLTENFDFSYAVGDYDIITTNNFLEAVNKTVKLIEQELKDLNLKKIALCLSGSDSELIAHFFYMNNIPIEYFFLDIDGINRLELNLCEKISKKYNTNLNVYSISSNELISNLIYENFNITKVCWPTYATLPSLIKKIPDDLYIVLGEGDLEKGWPRYKKIYQNKYVNCKNDTNIYIPIHLTEISYNLALKYYNKHGESNFYSKCFDLWYHILNDKNLLTSEGWYYDPKTHIMNKLITNLNLISPLKTMNYDDETNNVEKRSILKNKIVNNLLKYGNTFNNWNPYIGDLVAIPKKNLV